MAIMTGGVCVRGVAPDRGHIGLVATVLAAEEALSGTLPPLAHRLAWKSSNPVGRGQEVGGAQHGAESPLGSRGKTARSGLVFAAVSSGLPSSTPW